MALRPLQVWWVIGAELALWGQQGLASQTSWARLASSSLGGQRVQSQALSPSELIPVIALAR